ncbi:hypothetical protein ACIQW9_04565 [Herminiimonas sp. NPDC097707]|uniref:hypothetical protein n=1 Tax=Herminiimonas sp. NPDC097707 TaxID=3364007 RepID=UPI00383BBFF8
MRKFIPVFGSRANIFLFFSGCDYIVLDFEKMRYQLICSILRSVLGVTKDGKTGGEIDVRKPNSFGFGKDGGASWPRTWRSIAPSRWNMLSAVQIALAIAAEGNPHDMALYHNKGRKRSE